MLMGLQVTELGHSLDQRDTLRDCLGICSRLWATFSPFLVDEEDLPGSCVMGWGGSHGEDFLEEEDYQHS